MDVLKLSCSGKGKTLFPMGMQSIVGGKAINAPDRGIFWTLFPVFQFNSSCLPNPTIPASYKRTTMVASQHGDFVTTYRGTNSQVSTYR